MLTGPGAPVVTFRWYFTDLPMFDGVTVINNRVFDSDPWKNRPLGELPSETKQFRMDYGRRAPRGTTGRHICHLEWFRTGEPYPNDLPPNEYQPNGIPLCCQAFADATAGGLEVGGAVGDVSEGIDATAGGVQLGGAMGDAVEHVDATAGGLQLGGAMGDAVEHVDATAGGLQLGGAMGDAVEHVDATAGGLQLGGAMGDAVEHVDATAGGLQLGGAMGDAVEHVDATAGGLQLGGAMGDAVEHVDATAGGLQLGGAMGDAVEHVDATAGGVQLGGAVADVSDGIDATAGGLEVGGAVGDVGVGIDATAGGVEVGGEVGDGYTPATGPPGGSCGSAGPIAPGGSYSGAVAGGTNDWFKLSTTAGVQYTATITVAGANKVVLSVFDGSCAALNLITGGIIPTDGPAFPWTAIGTGDAWLRIAPFGKSSMAYVVALSSP
jgi:filamentous hemagglutinin